MAKSSKQTNSVSSEVIKTEEIKDKVQDVLDDVMNKEIDKIDEAEKKESEKVGPVKYIKLSITVHDHAGKLYHKGDIITYPSKAEFERDFKPFLYDWEEV